MIPVLSINNLFPGIATARYNIAAWQGANGALVTLGREVEKIARGSGQPDFGRLVLVEFDASGVMTREQIVWEPVGDSLWLEDPRALPLPDGSVLIGLTAVMRVRRGYHPYPALTRLSRAMWYEKTLPAITIVERFGAGKNITPIDDHTFLCRPERNEYSHRLLMFSFDELVARHVQDIEYPKDLEWGLWRMGTASPPLWIDDNSALMIVHGITIRDGLYVYSLGRARLDRKDGHMHITVARESILTPDDFLDNRGRPLVRQLHPKLRRVVYSCGSIITGDAQDVLALYVNVGDTATFEVRFLLAHLMHDLW